MTSDQAGRAGIMRAAVKLVIGIAALLILQVIVSNLAMLDQPIAIPGMYITYSVLGKAAIQTAIFVLLIRFGTDIRPAIEGLLPTAPEIGRVFQFGIWLIPAALAYSAYADIAEPVLGSGMWLYRLLFIAVIATLLIATAVLVFRNLDPLTELMLQQFSRPRAGRQPLTTGDLTCSSCNAKLPPNTQYCLACGKSLTTDAAAEIDDLHCPSCQSAIVPMQKFCRSCGLALQTP